MGKRWGLTILYAVVLSGCNYYEQYQQPVKGEMSFEGLSATVFQRCLPCHSAENARDGLVITDLENMLEVGWVVPGDMENSRVYMAVAEGSMPKGSKLSPDEIKLIRDWIMAGAPHSLRGRQTP